MSPPIQDLHPTRARHLKTIPMKISKVLIKNFSSTSGRRKPPTNAKKQHARLITIKPSHYCEKGRWAMDLVEEDQESPVYYTEDAHPPALSSFATIEASKDTASATPMLLLDSEKEGEEPELIVKSDEILRRMCPKLYPKAVERDVQTMEDDLGQRLGAAMRVYCYHYMLQKDYYSPLAKACGSYTSIIEYYLFKMLLPLKAAEVIRKVMKIDEETAKSSKASVEEVFEEISDLLSKNGGAYIMDSAVAKDLNYGFTAADLTFAALAFPLLRPSQMDKFNCTRIPDECSEFAEKLSKTRAGKHALKMYAEHRLPKGQEVVSVKRKGRNRISTTVIIMMIARVAMVYLTMWYFRSKEEETE